MKERIVLAYSGGLDTSVAIPWLAERYGAEVIAVTLAQCKLVPAAQNSRARAGHRRIPLPCTRCAGGVRPRLHPAGTPGWCDL